MKKNNMKKSDNSNTLANIKSFNLPFWIIGLFFAAITLVFFWDIISGNSFFWEDFVEHVYPTQSFAAKADELPFWNPFAFGGMPFLADIQVGFFYPLNRIFSIFVGADNLVPISVMQNVNILHFFIALCSMYALMRAFKVSQIGSIISAVSYAFSFNLVLHIIHPMVLAHLSWFPLVVMLLYRGITEASLRYGIIGGLIFGMSILSGHPQILLYEGLFLFVFAIWHIVVKIKSSEKQNIVKVLLPTILVFVIAIGIFQIQYMHTMELTENTLRSEMTYEQASEGSLEIKQLFTALVPKMFGYEKGDRNSKLSFQMPTTDASGKTIRAPYYYYWETSFYFGLVAIMLGLYAFIAMPKKNPHKLFFLTIAIFGFLFALGKNGFLLPIFHNLPFFSNFRFPSRMTFFVTFAFTAMAGFGFDRLSEASTEKSNKEMTKLIATIATVLLGVIIVLSGAFTPTNVVGDASLISEFATTALILTLIIAALMLLQHKKKMTNITGAILIIIAFIDLYIAGGDFNLASENPAEKYKINQEQLALFTPKYPNNLFRVSMRHKDYGIIAMQRNIGLVNGIMLVEGYNPLVMKRYELPFKTREERNKLWNTKYEITVDKQRQQVYYRDRELENDFLPRAWFAHEIKTIDSNNIENYMMNNDIDFKKTVILEDKVNYNMPTDCDTNAQVVFTEYKNNELKLKTKSNTPAMLVLSEIYYPAWRAKINGQEAKIHRANYNFRAIYVPAGENNIEMKYYSEAFATGKTITIITLICAVLGLIATFLKKDKIAKKTEE